MTSKEHKEDSSTARCGCSTEKTGGGGGGAAVTVGSHRDRSRRVSALARDVVAAEKKSLSIHRGKMGNETSLSAPATTPMITTECKSSKGAGSQSNPIIRVLHRRGSSWDSSMGRRTMREDEVELNAIHVQTVVHTREVEVGGTNMKRGRSRESEESDEWVASRKGVVSERLV